MCIAIGGASPRAATLETVASAYRKNPAPATRAALVQFANAHPKDRDGALALLALGATELEKGQFADTAKHLESARPRLTPLDDYAAFLRGSERSHGREGVGCAAGISASCFAGKKARQPRV